MMDALRGWHRRVVALLVRTGAANDAHRAFRAEAQALLEEGRAALAAERGRAVAALGPDLSAPLDPDWLELGPGDAPGDEEGFDLRVARALLEVALGNRGERPGRPPTAADYTALELRDIPAVHAGLKQTLAATGSRIGAVGAGIARRLDAGRAAALSGVPQDDEAPSGWGIARLAARVAKDLIGRTHRRTAARLAKATAQAQAEVADRLTAEAEMRFRRVRDAIGAEYLVPYWRNYELQVHLGRVLNRLSRKAEKDIPLADIREAGQWPEVFARLVTDNLDLVISQDGRKLVHPPIPNRELLP